MWNGIKTLYCKGKDFKWPRPGKKYDGGLFNGKEEIEVIETPKKEFLTLNEIFRTYNNRILVDKNGMKLLVKNGKFRFQTDEKSFQNYKNVVSL